MFDFSNQVVVITGALGNLGTATARNFAAAGAMLGLLDLRSDDLKTTLGEYVSSSNHKLFAPVDMTDAQSVETAIGGVIEAFGRLDVLFNAAGGYRAGNPLHETELEQWDFMLGLNARSAFLASRAAIPQMLRQGSGKIINVGARPGLKGSPNAAAYSASKSAVIRITESMAAELRGKGINVNCVLPGTMDTPQNRKAMPDAKHERWVPLQAVADVVQFLASDAARAIHGASVPVFGLT
jgi:NAD(P)-dependent dehydrogenase (short-subunit alcohol dehydrogenase family)